MLRDIKARLAYSGLSQGDLAEGLHISPATISHWLNGRTKLPEGMEARIGHAITRLENAEAAAQEARERSLAESAAAAAS